MIGAEQRGGIKDRVIKAGIDIFTRTDPPESRKSIWDRFPELKKIPEDRWPQNVFIIPDGNGRWAQARKLAVQAGHEKGAQVIVDVLTDASQLADLIPFIGAWGLSMDNLKRDKEERDFLMELFGKTVQKLRPDLIKRNQQFVHIGRPEIFEDYPHIEDVFRNAEEETKNNTGQTIYIAIGFSGDDQELRINREIVKMVHKGQIIDPAIDINPELIKSLRDGQGLIPPADLIIRSSGEQRLSGLGWIGEGSELYFEQTLFPNVGTKHLVKAILGYSKRDRRFGERSEKDK